MKFKYMCFRCGLHFENKTDLPTLLDFSTHYTIKVLNLHGTKITDAELAEIAKNFPNLTSLNLRCTDITGEGLADLENAFPNLNKWVHRDCA